MATERPLAASLLTSKVVVARRFEPLAERNYGKERNGRLELGLIESLYLVERGKIIVSRGKVRHPFAKLMAAGLKIDRRIHEKYLVYRDLRDRGLVVKTGFKFGCDFRVYQRGVGVKRGPKAPSEHTKWIVYALPEDGTCSFQELSRAVRLAHSIRARMLWAIVDNEGDVTYLEAIRIKP
ncbi:MAG: tRNA-intron lyase [Candidatus Aenigmarchaeota archaeon]|nr:tRNA-intron lyase [Candidatus Aenigmarchaeota archaeon]